jgi:hypothetical protein
VLKQGIRVDPYYRRSYKALALLFISQKCYEKALQVMRQELEIFPRDSYMRRLLKKGESASRR